MLLIFTMLVSPIPALRRAPSKALREVNPSDAPETRK
jgi:hypothetical protein